MEAVRHVRQRFSRDCGIACLAMVLDCDIEQAEQAFDGVYPEAISRGRGRTEGITDVELDIVLAERGFATARLYQGPRDNRREPWPPEPWSDVHLAQVILPNGGHFVVLLGDGAVLDPASPQQRRLTDYPEVMSVAAVVPVNRSGS